nr:hypothetical protein [Tanacetum cinerariifolium]
MLAPISAWARHSAILGKSHGIKNLPRSLSFSGLRALTGEATGSMIEELTGSVLRIRDSVRTTRGWTSSVLPLLVGCIVSLVASVSRSTTGEEEVVGIVGLGYAVPLRVVIPFRSSFGLVIVLPRRVPEPEDEAAEESRVDEPKLSKQELDKLVLGKDYAKIVKNQSKPGNIRHEIESLHQRPDQRAFFYNNQANEDKCQKIESSRAILVIYPKSISKEKRKLKFK